MAATTTTVPTIRNGIRDTIQALTPSTGSNYPFEVYKLGGAFEEWCEENNAACFRRFNLRRSTDRAEADDLSDGEVERLEETFDLVIAYPHAFGLYGDLRGLSLDDIATEDAEQIRKAIGYLGSANYVSGQGPTWADYGIEVGNGVDFVVFEVRAMFYQTV